MTGPVVFAGLKATADELNSGFEIGGKVMSAVATTDSSTWTGAAVGTKVLTNLTGTGLCRSGGIYECRAKLCVVLSVGATGYASCGIYYRAGGGLTATNGTLVDVNTEFMEETGAVYGLTLEGEFTAASTGSFEFGVVGGNELGSATIGLRGSSAYARNRLSVKRIA